MRTLYQNSQPLPKHIFYPLLHRFEFKYEIIEPGGCWIWMGTIGGDGYGQIAIGSYCNGTRQTLCAHRVSWELYRGPIPRGVGAHGMCVLHHCDNTLCVNPDHLWLGSNHDNMRDKANKGRASLGGRRKMKLGSAHG